MTGSPDIRACVIGFPITHSRSPQLHTYWLDQYGIDGCYAAESIAPDGLPDFLLSVKQDAAGYCGGNATIPHKEALLALADKADATARILGAANTFWSEHGALHVSNTDTYGFLANLDAAVPQWDRRPADISRKAVVLGAGGAARAIVFGLISRGFTEIVLANRTLSRAEKLVGHFAAAAEQQNCRLLPLTLADAEAALVHTDLLVNATSLGMVGQDELEISLTRLPVSAVVTDIVYTPLQTGLLSAAQGRGNRTVDGLGMLLHQAVPGFERWFGIRPQVTEALHRHMLQDL
uniref:shikimate dehydrogenase n=1 Tax=Pararhizobium sp. IMCC3301 TaxID=3067904 RepID=UPI0027423EB5|nr:shikimate dehydrogenase [Pararhizobium sp. IMCC3301]